ncbi:hemoglobin/transferrin/lactoferrin receptor protein [Dyadobacter jejuensis]|uniref:Hemoglobin/transferrin/lactoferrin receptor protein n=1 Tax=Dyadobacter jejuensis TaxID=1082580 RepID=A0A316AM89_9BACT|nr:TonB-dependent receptor [Dyadobacter jejuensis]PWJ58681.1 hemoglobin/transferrin/lactoferrin receptor protein [Dyadobacter jejuensis]
MKLILFLSILIISSLPVLAQPTDTLRTELLNQINVTAHRTQETALSTSASISSINSTTLKSQQGSTTPDALMGSTGVFVQKTTQGGGSPFVRGLTGNQTLTLIDGIRLNNSTFRYGPNQYLNTVDPWSLQRVEVLRGGGSVAYGTDALGGTIQLFTHQLSFSDSRQYTGLLRARVATSGMEKSLRAQAGMSHQRVALMAGLSLKNFGDLVGGDSTGRQSPSGYKDLAFDIKGKIYLTPRWNLTLAHQTVQQKHVPVFYKYQLDNYKINEFHPQNRSLSYLKLQGTHASKWIRNIAFTSSFQSTKEGRSSQRNGSSLLSQDEDKINTLGLTLNIHSEFTKNWTASSGIEVYQDWVNSKGNTVDLEKGSRTDKRGLYPNGSTNLNYGVYSLHQFISNKWKFDIGGRINGFRIKLTDEAIGKVSISPTAVVANAAIAYQASPRSNIYTSFHSGFRAPNIDDMGTLGIVDFRYELPAYGLKPEKSYNYELGYKLQTGGLHLNMALFQNYLNNLITRERVAGEQIDGVDVYRKENTEKAQIRGAEIEIDYLFQAHWKIFGAGTYTYGKSISNQEPLRRIPPLNGRLGIEYRPGNLFLRPELLWAYKQTRLSAGDKSDNRIPVGGTPGWTTVNLRMGYDWKVLSLQAMAQNLFNTDYRTHGSGINGAGRSLWVTVSAQF